MKIIYAIFFFLVAAYLVFHLGLAHGRMVRTLDEEITQGKAELRYYKSMDKTLHQVILKGN